MTSRACLVGLLAAALLLSVAPPAVGDSPPTVSSYYAGRADPRLCPSPMCGGVWVKLVNRSETACGDAARREECYVAESDLTRLPVDDRSRAQLQAAVTEGRAIVRGDLVRGRVAGFPELDVLVVSEVWVASSSRNRATGTFHTLRDRGIRCIAAPCFRTHAAALNTGAHANVSAIDLVRSGAPAGERRSALQHLPHVGLITAGRVVADRSAGRKRVGRKVVATQFYVRADIG
jgi:hypothetical protein